MSKPTDQPAAAPNERDDPATTDTAAVDRVSAEKPARTGPEVIAGHLRTLTSQPGVYRMLDAEGTVIYVGKAHNLKARVSNYARMGGHTNRIARMIQATASMEFVTVRTEAEALLLKRFSEITLADLAADFARRHAAARHNRS